MSYEYEGTHNYEAPHNLKLITVENPDNNDNTIYTTMIEVYIKYKIRDYYRYFIYIY
jgi:hypothetical protein